MRKIILIFLILLGLSLSVSLVSAINIKIENQEPNVGVMIKGVNEPAIFVLNITNLDSSDNFQFYNLLGFNMAPKETVFIKGGESKEVKLMIYPREDMDYEGYYTIEYYIKSQDSSKVKEELTLKIIDFQDAFEVGSEEISPESEQAEAYVHNKENFNFEKLNARLKSPFFDFTESFALKPNEKKTFVVDLNKENFKNLMAGFYTVTAEISSEDAEAVIEGKIRFAESESIETSEKKSGFIITTRTIEKINGGNVEASSRTTIKKNIISRLFSSFNPEPDFVKREGFVVYYTWDSDIKPGEVLQIVVRTNWLLPLLIIFFIIAIVVLAKQYSKTNLVLRKKVSFVRAKGGEFALKVSVFVSAKKYVERITITDRLPHLVKIYERFGGEKPAKVDEKARKIEWNFEKLEAGEMRVLSYIIYSKLGILGKFALPTALAVYEREGSIQETESNKAFFLAEQLGKKEIERE